MRSRLLSIVSLCCLASCVFAQNPVVRNPGFETANGGIPTDWTCPTYWSGEFKSVTDVALVHGGKRAAELKAAEKQGRTWGRIHSNVFTASVGLNYRYGVFVRGTGALKLGVINYLPSAAGETKYESIWQPEPLALTDQWQEAVLEYKPVSAKVQRFALMVEVEGPDAVAVLDDVTLQVARQEQGELVAPVYLAVRQGQRAKLTARLTRAGQPVAGYRLTLLQPQAEEPLLAELQTDANGVVTFEAEPCDMPTLNRIEFIQPQMGLAVATYCDVLPAAVYDEFAAAARAVRLKPLPMHLLFFGDSLTDFTRGCNYVDQAAYWLNQAHDGQITYRNAGVGGDYITRSLDRLNGKEGTWRLEAYEGIYEPRPARVFMMLGHNDSKLTSTSGFTEAVVKPEDYKAQFIEFIGKVKEKTGGAPFTLLSPTSSVYEITKANADKAVAAGRGASLFGKPEVMAQYTELTREVAQATSSDFVDVFTPTRDHAHKPSLFTADGVHLSHDGNRLLALELLNYLGRP